MTQKMTYIEALSYAIDNLTNAPADVIEKLTALKAQTEKRNKAIRKPTKKQVEALDIIATIRDVLASTAKPLSVAEIRADDRLNTYSTQKISALLTVMGDEVECIPTKRNNTYRLVA